MPSRHFSVALDGPSTQLQGVEYFRAHDEFAVADPFEDERLLDRVRGLEYGHMLLDRSGFNGLAQAETTATFTVSSELLRTREESTKEVECGQLVLRTVEDREAAALIAVKSFDTARQAVNEYRAMRYFNTLVAPPGKYSSFMPLGFIIDAKKRKTAVASLYDHSVISYDNLFWNEEQAPSELEAKKAIGNCALTLGYIHAHGFRFGDTQAKNFARGNEGPRLIDLESVQTLRGKRGHIDPVEGLRKTNDDVSQFVRSIHRFKGDDYSALLKDTFAPLYLGMTGSSLSQLPEDARLTLTEIYDTVDDIVQR